MINLHLITSKQIYSYRKLNLPLTNSIYLLFLPLEMQRKLKQAKVYHSLFHFVWKETTHKPLKVAAPKTLFSSVYIIDKTCLNECFFITCVNRKAILFIKVYCLLVSTTMLMLSLKPVFWKKSVFYIMLLNFPK